MTFVAEQDIAALQPELVAFLRWKRALDVDDIVQEVLLRILQKIRSGAQIENLSAFGRRVAELVDWRQLELPANDN